jgi:putative spermidine/putrescine transport system permease protein
VSAGAAGGPPGAAGRSSAPALLAALLVAAPVLAGLGYAAAGAVGLAGVGAEGFTTGRLARVLAEPAVWASVAFTLRTALLSTLLAAALGVLVAVAFRGSGAADRLARALAVVPLPVPQVVAAACAVLVLGQSGLLARLAHAAGLAAAPQDVPALVNDPAGVALVLALGWKEFPFLALVAASVLATRSAAPEEAARTLGATPWQAFRRVTWPLLWRGLLPSAAAVFAFVVGSYEAAALLGPSAPVPLQSLIRERYADLDLAVRGDAYVLTLVALAVAGLAVAAHEWAAGRGDGAHGDGARGDGARDTAAARGRGRDA